MTSGCFGTAESKRMMDSSDSAAPVRNRIDDASSSQEAVRQRLSSERRDAAAKLATQHAGSQLAAHLPRQLVGLQNIAAVAVYAPRSQNVDAPEAQGVQIKDLGHGSE